MDKVKKMVKWAFEMAKDNEDRLCKGVKMHIIEMIAKRIRPSCKPGEDDEKEMEKPAGEIDTTKLMDPEDGTNGGRAECTKDNIKNDMDLFSDKWIAMFVSPDARPPKLKEIREKREKNGEVKAGQGGAKPATRFLTTAAADGGVKFAATGGMVTKVEDPELTTEIGAEVEVAAGEIDLNAEDGAVAELEAEIAAESTGSTGSSSYLAVSMVLVLLGLLI